MPSQFPMHGINNMNSMNYMNSINNPNFGSTRLIANSNIGNINKHNGSRMNCNSSTDDTSGGDSRNKWRNRWKTDNYNQKEQNMNKAFKKLHSKHKDTFIY